MTKRIGIIGLGQQAKDLYIPAAQASPAVEIVGVQSATPDNVATLAQSLGVKGYTDVEQMLDECKPDFVVAMVPHDQYVPVVEAAAKRGIHLLKGKPLARNVEEARHVVGIAQAACIKLMITVPRRFNLVYVAAHEALPSIGPIFFSEFHSTLGLSKPAGDWRHDLERAGGGCILDMGYHMIDILLWFQGMPRDIRATYSHNGRPEQDYDTEDTAAITYAFPNSYGVMTLSRIMPPYSETVRMLGQRGMIEIANNQLTIYDGDGKVASQQTFQVNKQNMAQQQLEYFCQVIDGQKENVETGGYNLQHMQFIEQCYRSGSH